MSKFKILLLGGFVSIFSIGGFTNSQFISEESISLSWDNQVITPGTINLPVPINQINFTANPGGDACSVLFEKDGRWRCRVYFNVYSNPAYSFCNNENGTASTLEKIIGDVDVKYDARTCGDGSFSMNYTIIHDQMPVSALTPVISGLSDSINEFIPYVVYVGLGVLGALIGFVAIKWLINRVRRQSFGVFSSRKKK